MQGASARIGGGFLALVAIWIGVYWLWEPSRSVEVTYSDPPTPEAEESATVPAEPEPRAPAPDASVERQAAAPPVVEPEAPDVGVIAPQFREYTIRRGDSFSSISRRLYGTTRHAGAIAAANPFVSPTNLREGKTLRIPLDPENVQGVPTGGGEEAAVEAEFIEYVVVRGDTLSEIAQRFYGSLRYAEVIFNANRDTMDRMDDLQIGDVLRIPSPESVLGESDR